jgi:hypothetical protein
MVLTSVSESAVLQLENIMAGTRQTEGGKNKRAGDVAGLGVIPERIL